MRLSDLQRYILRHAIGAPKAVINRSTFTAFYQRRTAPHSIADSITESLERLIDKGLMTGYGRRTPKKWFIEQIRLTSAGRRIAKTLLGTQQKLPLQ